MGDILEFPSQQTQGLAFLDRQVRELLTAKGADDRLVDFAAQQLTEMYAQLSTAEQYSFSVELPAHLDDAEKNSLDHQINAGLEGIRQPLRPHSVRRRAARPLRGVQPQHDEPWVECIPMAVPAVGSRWAMRVTS